MNGAEIGEGDAEGDAEGNINGTLAGLVDTVTVDAQRPFNTEIVVINRIVVV